MLAERRKKVIYSNPRGLLWANDEQKFGQRMLKSMGWKEGKGLGKDESGITQNIKASFKFDNKGFGYKQNVNGWIEENNVYEKILADLAQQHTNTQSALPKESNSVGDLEQKTKKSNRLHYRKFIKAKNLSIKSEEDLFCIFPTSKETNNDLDCLGVSQQESVLTEANNKNQVPNETKLITVESKLSIDDYFSQKMKSKLLNSTLTPKMSREKPADSEINEIDSNNQLNKKHKKRKLNQKCSNN